MTLRQLKPCDKCGGHIGSGSYVLRMSLLIVNANALNATGGIAQMLGGGPSGWGIAEALSPDTNYVIVAGDEEPELMTELVLCQQCVLGGSVDLASLLEHVRNAAAAEGGDDE